MKDNFLEEKKEKIFEPDSAVITGGMEFQPDGEVMECDTADPALEHPVLRKVIKLLPLAGLIICIILIILAWNAGLLQSEEKMTQFVKDMGSWGPVVFLVITIVSVVVPIIPFGLGLLAGVVIFGELHGFILNYFGICLGSMAAFAIGRHVGRPVLRILFSDKQIEKYDSWIEKIKFNWIFALAIFMPVAPDDYLVYFAGTTKMRWRFFTPIIWLGKPSSIFLYTFIVGKIFDGAVSVFSGM